MRRGTPHEALTDFRLCKEFGWTPTELAKQSARVIHQYIVVMNEIDRQVEEEKKKANSKR